MKKLSPDAAIGDADDTATTKPSGDARPGIAPGSAAHVQPPGTPGTTHAPTSPAAAAALHRFDPAYAAPTPPADQVAIHITRAVRAGLDRIEIQLSPASLGRIEIRLDIADRQHVTASLSAERSDALDLLRADGRVLERALQDAGLKTDSGSLSFHLRDHGARPGHEGGAHPGFVARQGAGVTAAEAEPDLPPLSLSMRTSGGIDIRA